jgi:hypothetical protein
VIPSQVGIGKFGKPEYPAETLREGRAAGFGLFTHGPKDSQLFILCSHILKERKRISQKQRLKSFLKS